MSRAKNLAGRSGTLPVQIGNVKLAPDSNDNLKVTDGSDADTKIIASEIHLGDSNNRVIIKKDATSNNVAFETQAGSGTPQSSNVGGSVTAYDNVSALPSSGVTEGDMALIRSPTNKLFIRTATGWYLIAVISNATPVIDETNILSSYTFQTNGTPITITVPATDPEGESITYSHSVTSGSISGIASIQQGTGASVNQFTLTPQTSGNGGSFQVTFHATDPNGQRGDTSGSTFSLSFFSAMKIPSGTTMLFGLSMDNIPSGLDLFAVGSSGGSTTLASNSAFDFGTNDFTIEWFYRWEAASGYHTFLNHNYTSAGGITIQSNSSNRAWGLWGDVSVQYESSNATRGIWYHYALCRHNNLVKLYRNGTETLSKAHTGSIGSTNTTVFGDHAGSYPAKGRASNFRVVKGTALYTSAGFTPPVAPLTAVSGTSLLIFQESSGSTLSDASSNNIAVTKSGNHAILTADGPEVVGHRGTWSLDTYTSNGNVLATPTIVSSGGYHVSSNGHVHYSNPTSTGLTGFRIPEMDTNNACKGKTIICWYKGQSSQNVNGGYYAMGVPILGDYQNQWFHIGIDGGKIAVNSGQGYTRGTTNVCDNNWHMLTYIHSDGTHTRLNNDEMGLWVDGTYETKHSVYAYGNLRILNHMFVTAGTVQHPERVDSFQIFDSELTDAQISEIYGA